MNEENPPIVEATVDVPEFKEDATEVEHFNALKDAYKTVAEMQAKLDCKEWTTYGGALSIQHARERLKAHKAAIKGPRLAYSHPDPESLPTPVKRSRNEVREFMGLPPIEEDDA